MFVVCVCVVAVCVLRDVWLVVACGLCLFARYVLSVCVVAVGALCVC